MGVSPVVLPDVGSRDRARHWLEQLAGDEFREVESRASVLSANINLGSERALGIAIVRDPDNPAPRARHGEMGLEQSLMLAALVRNVIAEDAGPRRRPLVAIVDTPGQAYGAEEERQCLSFACASAVEAYITARMAGHPVLTLVVGNAISGSFLAHGLQSDVIVALTGEGVSMYAMGIRSAARIMRRTVARIQQMASTVLPMSYAIEDAHRLGIIDELLVGIDPASPGREDVERIKHVLAGHLQCIREGQPVKRPLTENPSRAATVAVHTCMSEQWANADLSLKRPG